MTESKEDKKNEIVLPARLDVRCTDENYRIVLDDLRRYRAAARQAFCALAMAQIAGAKIVEHSTGIKVDSDNEAAKTILAKTMGMSVAQRTKPAVSKALKSAAEILKKVDAREKMGDALARRLDEVIADLSDAASRHNWAEDVSDQGAAPAYELRDFILRDLLPGFKPFAFDGLRREIVSLWTSKDPEFPKATRGWLMLNGARMLARFNRLGLEFPILSGAHSFGSNDISLNWRGNPVQFKLLDMDRARWQQWTDARDGACKIGSIVLSEKDGLLRIIIPLIRPILESTVDLSRHGSVLISQSKIATDGPGLHDELSTAPAIAQMIRLKRQSEYFDSMKRPTGSPVKKWGSKKAYASEAERLKRITQRRTDAQRDWNHRWTRRITDNLVRSRCGTCVFSVPEKSELVAGVPWSWSEFKNFLTYKCKMKNITVV